jgi:hypothetical protein
MSGIFTDEELEAAQDTLPQTEDGAPATEVQRNELGQFAPKEDAEPAAAEPDAEAPAEEKPKREGTVPQGALHAEREKRKSVEAELTTAREQRKSVEAELTTAREQLQAIAELRRQIAERQPAPLPAADDPAALDHLRQRIEQQDHTLNQFQQQRDSEAVNQAEIMQLRSVMETSEGQFRAAQPDYDQAVDYVMQARARELSLYGLNPMQVQQAIAEEVTDIARTAVAQGRNPAELGYQIALSRGYRPAQVEHAAAPSGGGAVAQVEAIARGQAANKSVGSGSGVRTQQLNAEAIVAMSPDEFDALYSTPEGRKLIDNL